jgi:hypothetical protein
MSSNDPQKQSNDNIPHSATSELDMADQSSPPRLNTTAPATAFTTFLGTRHQLARRHPEEFIIPQKSDGTADILKSQPHAQQTLHKAIDAQEQLLRDIAESAQAPNTLRAKGNKLQRTPVKTPSLTPKLTQTQIRDMLRTPPGFTGNIFDSLPSRNRIIYPTSSVETSMEQHGPNPDHGPNPLPSETLPVGAVNAIQIATQLAPHIAAASSALEHNLRLESAKKEMQRQLQLQRLELEEQQARALLLEQKKSVSRRLELEEQQSRALLLEQEKSALLRAKLDKLEQALLSLTSASQPIMVHSSSRTDALNHQITSSSTAMPAVPRSVSPTKATSEQQMQAVHDHDLQLQSEYATLLKKQLSLLLPEAMSDILRSQAHNEQPLLAYATAPLVSPLESPRPLRVTTPAPAVPVLSDIARMNQGLARLNAASALEEAEKHRALEQLERATLLQQANMAATDQLSTLAKQRQKAIAEQQLKIEQAQRRIQSLSGSNPVNLPVAPRKSARQRERELAIFTNDKDLLRHGSRKLGSESESEDDADEIAREQSAALACHNLMNPKSKIPLRTPDGYVKSIFIKPDSESDSEEEEEDEIDDDMSPDYVEASQERSLSREEYEQWRAQSMAQPRQQAPVHSIAIPSELQSTLCSISKEEWDQWQAHKRGPTPIQTTDLPALLSAIISSSKSSNDGRMQVALNPPVHGDWDDVNHLMKVYMPLYEKYEASCGLKAESIFSAYSLTQKKRLAKLFTKQSDGVIIRAVTVEDLQRMTNEQFTTMLCKEKGYKTSTLTEDALKAIVWKGKFTDKTAWINHETNWEDCLAQTSKKGAIDKKRLIVLYRQSIPEPFIQKHLLSKRFDSWQQCHNYMAEEMIIDADFLTEWKDDCSSRPPAAPERPAKERGSSQGGGAAMPPAKAPHPSSNPPSSAPASLTPAQETALQYRDKHGKLNVNPNMILDLDLNPQKLVCGRCGQLHKWLEAFCTAFKNKADQLIEPKLTFDQIKKATLARWNAGFFAAKDPNSRPAPHSPSVQQAAGAAATTRDLLTQQPH